MPRPGPDAPVNTIAISNAEQLAATLTLANHNSLLFFPTLNSPDVRVVALLPGGQTAWQATIQKAQVAKIAKTSFLDLGSHKLITIEPLLLTSAGNKTYSVETILEAADGLPRHALLVQALDATGRVAGKTFAVPAPRSPATRTMLTAYATDGVVYAVAREENPRTKTGQFFLDRCDLGSGKLTHTALSLPPPPVVRHGSEVFRDWVFGGIRGSQCYFYRAVKGTGPQAEARTTPVEFEVKRLGLDGRERASFRTALQRHLPAGTVVQGGTSYPHHGQAHAPRLLEAAGNADQYDTSTGGNADFYLDEATGNCHFLGQYSATVFDGRAPGSPSLGTFVQRYGPDGTFLKAKATPYAALAGFRPGQLTPQLRGSIISNVLYSPETQELTLQYWTPDHFVVSGYDARLAPRPVQLVPQLPRQPQPYFNSQIISWSGPSYLVGYANTTGAPQPQLMLDALLVSPISLHRSIGRLVDRQLAAANLRKSKTAAEYTVAPIGPAAALVLAAPEGAGGQVDVYVVR
ncbi:hypothetical protein GCM10022407_11740 [Hymenobacter antarcticus]|uniref:Uncharacterized protein n=2 Tax=Hymenobacter antarcticus TaxID=486270 RepID=A0ABP7PL06_9BACT